MLAVLAAVLGLLTAIVRRVPFSRIAGVRFRALWLLVPAIGLNLILNPRFLPADFSPRLAEPPLPGLLPLGSLLFLTAEAFAMAFLFANRRVPGFSLILAGLALNFVAIVANVGYMPGDPSQLERAGQLQGRIAHFASGRWSMYSVGGPGTKLGLLTDWIPVPTPPVGVSVVSIGDLVIAVGEVLFFNPKQTVEPDPRVEQRLRLWVRGATRATGEGGERWL
jgi:hypothetical protein